MWGRIHKNVNLKNAHKKLKSFLLAYTFKKKWSGPLFQAENTRKGQV